MSEQIEIVKKYIALTEKMDLNEATAAGLLAPDYSQWELPNLLNKSGQKSDRADTFRRMALAKNLIAGQKFEITNILEHSSTVVMESIWSGTLAIDAGPLKKGQTLRAFFCMIFDFKEGRIQRVRNYDCFEPF